MLLCTVCSPFPSSLESTSTLFSLSLQLSLLHPPPYQPTPPPPCGTSSLWNTSNHLWSPLTQVLERPTPTLLPYRLSTGRNWRGEQSEYKYMHPLLGFRCCCYSRRQCVHYTVSDTTLLAFLSPGVFKCAVDLILVIRASNAIKCLCSVSSSPLAQPTCVMDQGGTDCSTVSRAANTTAAVCPSQVQGVCLQHMQLLLV